MEHIPSPFPAPFLDSRIPRKIAGCSRAEPAIIIPRVCAACRWTTSAESSSLISQYQRWFQEPGIRGGNSRMASRSRYPGGMGWALEKRNKRGRFAREGATSIESQSDSRAWKRSSRRGIHWGPVDQSQMRQGTTRCWVPVYPLRSAATRERVLASLAGESSCDTLSRRMLRTRLAAPGRHVTRPVNAPLYRRATCI